MALCNSLSNYFSTRLRYDIESKASQLLMAKYARLSVAQREDKKISDLFEQAEQFTDQADWIFDRGVSIAGNMVSLVGALIALAAVSPWLGLIIIAALLPSFMLQLGVNRRERFMWKNNSINRRRASAYRHQLLDIHYLSELRLSGLTDMFVRRWREYFIKDREQRMALEKKTLPRNLGTVIVENVVVVGVLIWGAAQIIAGRLPIGYFVTLQRLVNGAQDSLGSVLWMVASAAQDILNTNDFYNFLNLPEESLGQAQIETKNSSRIEFRNVEFTYPLNKEPTLKEVSFVIEPGEHIAFVGENGSGKTTIIKLLLGFYRPDKGEILIDDVPLTRIDPVSWYRHIGVLFQSFAAYTFTTLADNIWFGDITKKPHHEAFARALKKADIGNLPKSLEHGYEQILGRDWDSKNSTDLSGGQWQRVGLARSFFRDASILVLDEPTSAVDAKAEYEIFQQIDKNQQGKTTIIISHRFSTVRKAQKIYVMKGGTISEHGSHEELMKLNGGTYKEMFELQAEGYK
jgi:ATP-binding cassette subfamily B protein/ATP-binding cassette subfamily C protein